MTRMRKPSLSLRGQSVPEIVDWTEREAKRLARLREPVKIRSRIVSAGTLLNAVVLHFAALSENDREMIVRRSLARYEAILDSDEPVLLDQG